MYIAETHTDALTTVFKLKKLIAEGQTKYQTYQIADVETFGKTLFLDTKTQSSIIDEHIYHECLTQPALVLHPHPKKVAVCGGGEGATLRDALKHNTVEKAFMIDIDEELVTAAKEHLPEWHQGSFFDKRTTLLFQDARKWIEDQKGANIDVILHDLQDPLEGGPAIYLFTQEFYKAAFDAMSPDGTFCLQAGSAGFSHPECFAASFKTLKSVFPVVRAVTCPVAPYMGQWGFIVASKKYDPMELKEEEIAKRFAARGVTTRYYTPRYHQAAYTLPEHLVRAIGEANVITDAKPFVWNG